MTHRRSQIFPPHTKNFMRGKTWHNRNRNCFTEKGSHVKKEPALQGHKFCQDEKQHFVYLDREMYERMLQESLQRKHLERGEILGGVSGLLNWIPTLICLLRYFWSVHFGPVFEKKNSLGSITTYKRRNCVQYKTRLKSLFLGSLWVSRKRKEEKSLEGMHSDKNCTALLRALHWT